MTRTCIIAQLFVCARW